MSSEPTPDRGTADTTADEKRFDWRRLVTRRERPLPRAGCSWAFYLFLLLVTAFLVFSYIKYERSAEATPTATENTQK